MIIDQPFNLNNTLKKLAIELEDYRTSYLRAINLYSSLQEILSIQSSEFTIGDIRLTYNTLYVYIHLSETGIFNSVEGIIEKISKVLQFDPEITDNQYAKGKTVNWSAVYKDSLVTAGLYMIVFGNSKCKLVVTETETKIVNKYRVECGELNEVKAITYVENDNAVGSDNGRLGSGKDLLDQ